MPVNKGSVKKKKLTRGLLSGLVERPDEAPLMDRDLLAQNKGEVRFSTHT